MQDLLARARSELCHEPIERRVRADDVVDSTRAILIWEPRRAVPSYAVPAGDIAAELTPAPATNGDHPGVLHPGVPFGVHTAAGEPVSIGGREGAGFRLADDDLAGYVALDFDAFEQWLEEDEPIPGHPIDPYHRIDVRRTSRALRIEIDGEVVAETTRARLLYETQLPTRFYLPREDVRAELRSSSRRTYCPFKGEASYWSLLDLEDIAWSYEEPRTDAAAVAGLVAFWDHHRIDVYLDGELRPKPGGEITAALHDEFGL
jgi:uncharacterized protein (DUF427 family)